MKTPTLTIPLGSLFISAWYRSHHHFNRSFNIDTNAAFQFPESFELDIYGWSAHDHFAQPPKPIQMTKPMISAFTTENADSNLFVTGMDMIHIHIV